MSFKLRKYFLERCSAFVNGKLPAKRIENEEEFLVLERKNLDNRETRCCDVTKVFEGRRVLPGKRGET